MQVIGGSLLMMLGVGAIALSSATGTEQAQWQEAALRECRRYGMDKEYVKARMQGAAATRRASIFTQFSGLAAGGRRQRRVHLFCDPGACAEFAFSWFGGRVVEPGDFSSADDFRLDALANDTLQLNCEHTRQGATE